MRWDEPSRPHRRAGPCPGTPAVAAPETPAPLVAGPGSGPAIQRHTPTTTNHLTPTPPASHYPTLKSRASLVAWSLRPSRRQSLMVSATGRPTNPSLQGRQKRTLSALAMAPMASAPMAGRAADTQGHRWGRGTPTPSPPLGPQPPAPQPHRRLLLCSSSCCSRSRASACTAAASHLWSRPCKAIPAGPQGAPWGRRKAAPANTGRCTRAAARASKGQAGMPRGCGQRAGHLRRVC